MLYIKKFLNQINIMIKISSYEKVINYINEDNY